MVADQLSLEHQAGAKKIPIVEKVKNICAASPEEEDINRPCSAFLTEANKTSLGISVLI